MSITLPTLPELGPYPANGTDAQRDVWFRLADLHVRRTQAQATDALADASAASASAAGAFPAAIAPTVDRILARWEASDAAMDRLTAAIAGFSPGTGGAGLTAEDVQIVGGLLAAARNNGAQG